MKFFRYTASVLLAFSVLGATATAACTGARYHEWDFFVGNWRVTDARGNLIGHDTVTKIEGDCVLRERYVGTHDPVGGIGLTGFGLHPNRWYQNYMDDTGYVLAIEGGLANGVMVMDGDDFPNGKRERNHVVWYRHGSVVNEHWTVSHDGGKTWSVIYDGWFHRT